MVLALKEEKEELDRQQQGVGGNTPVRNSAAPINTGGPMDPGETVEFVNEGA